MIFGKNNIKNIVEDLRCDHKEKVMYYLDKATLLKFREFCKKRKIKMSFLIEKLIKELLLIEETENQKEK